MVSTNFGLGRIGLRFLQDRQGGVLAYVALALPLILGVAGLSVDVGLWYAERRIVQGAADAGAMAGALEIMRTGSTSDINDAAERDAASNGYDAAAGDVLEVYNPPQSGISAGTSDAVEVIVRRPTDSFLSRFVHSGAPTVAGRAVAAVDIDDTCVYALNPTVKAAVKVNGGADINLNCGIKVNSNHVEAVDQTSAGSCLTTTLLKIREPGWYNGTCVNASEGIYTSVSTSDPMAHVEPPVPYESITCDHTAKVKVNGSQTVTIDPGTYCGAIEVSASGTLILNPGLYVLHGAGFQVSGQGTVEGDGVTFYITKDVTQPQTVDFQAGAVIHLSAPAQGEPGMPGVLFYQSREAPDNVSHNLTAGATMDLEGTLYFPTSDMNYAGGASLSATAAQLIADTVSFEGHSHIGEFEGSVIEANNALITAIILE